MHAIARVALALDLISAAWRMAMRHRGRSGRAAEFRVDADQCREEPITHAA